MNGNGDHIGAGGFEDFQRSLSEEEVRALFRNPFYDPASPLILQPPSHLSLLSASPLFLVVETLLKTVQQEGSIKLTQRNYLPPKLCREIYARRYITDFFIDEGITKITTEKDVMFIHTARIIAGIAGLIKVQNKRLSLTRKCNDQLTPENRFELFRTVFDTYTTEFNWAYNDRHTDIPVGQPGFGFTLLLLKVFGNESREARFYADIFRSAVPAVIDIFDEEDDPRPLEHRSPAGVNFLDVAGPPDLCLRNPNPNNCIWHIPFIPEFSLRLHFSEILNTINGNKRYLVLMKLPSLSLINN